MNTPNLSRRLATRIIEGLQGRGRIVVVRGGTSAIIRAIDDAITTFIAPIVERFEREQSPEADQHTREALTLLASAVARTLFSSEHLEDVFADRAIVEREVFDAALQTFIEASEADRARVMQIELDMLGYVAATAAKLASEEHVTVALERAADSLEVKLSRYDVETRQAIFEPIGEPFPDLRLELEEAVADELAALVTEGVVILPVIERTRPLEHLAPTAQRTKLLRGIERVASRTLWRTGCSATWSFPDERSVRVVFTPLSEQDARDVDVHVSEFVTELDTLLANAGAPLVTQAVIAPVVPAAPQHDGNGSLEEPEAPPESAPEPEVPPKRAPRSGMRAKAPRSTPKRAPAKRAAKRTEAPAAEKPTTRKKAPAKRASTTKKVRAAKKGQ